jgi:serine/threonine-protein kinase HipA
MPRKPTHPPLTVFMNGRRVGTLARAANGAIDFRYAEDWLAWENAIPVSLSLPLREDRYVGAPVMAVFDNLLPDAEPIRRRVAERVGARGIDAYSLLTALGQDCVGALQFLTEDREPGPVGTVEGRPVSDQEIGDLLRQLGRAPLGVGADRDFRISVAGAQDKTALLQQQGRWLKPIGTTATTHILKPAIGKLSNGIDLSHSVENEFFCLKLMAAFGLPMAKAEMADFGGVRTLVVERFDRVWRADGRLIRLPQEDCCQALSVPSTLKYQSDGGPGVRDLLALFKSSDEPERDIALILRAQAAFWLIGATDGHAKNFSLFLRPGGRFRMTPLYDVMSAEPSVAAGQINRRQAKLAMSLGRNRHYRLDEIMPRHLEQTAALADVDPTIVRELYREFVGTAMDTASRLAEETQGSVPDAVRLPVLDAIQGRLRLIEAAAGLT